MHDKYIVLSASRGGMDNSLIHVDGTLIKFFYYHRDSCHCSHHSAEFIFSANPAHIILLQIFPHAISLEELRGVCTTPSRYIPHPCTKDCYPGVNSIMTLIAIIGEISVTIFLPYVVKIIVDGNG